MEASETAHAGAFIETVREIGMFPLAAKGLEILQVNLGYRCNLACQHCHVQAGPHRPEMMARENIEAVIQCLAESPIRTLDLTGGAPELHPDFRSLVTTARAMGCHVMVRSNLAVFYVPGLVYLPAFYRENGVEVIASLPHFRAGNVDGVRGEGVFGRAIEALRLLNEHGYGEKDSRLQVHLVHNPGGAFLPPAQELLECRYRKELHAKHGVRFNRLYTLANMPLGRFKAFLLRNSTYDEYLGKLQRAFNPATLEGIMCRRLVNIGWDGALFDCDFNAIAGLKVAAGCPQHITDFDYAGLSRREIVLNDHCFGCTAGQGST